MNTQWGEAPLDTVPLHVETEVWVPREDGSGYLDKQRVKTVGEVCAELQAITGQFPEGCDDGYHIPAWSDPSLPWPDGRIAVFAVTGSSEGHYIHVDVHSDFGNERTAQTLILGKTFDGFDAAWSFAKRLAALLQA